MAKADGIETFDTLKSGAAPEEFSWKVTLEPGQKLVAGDDGSVAIVDSNADDGAPPPSGQTPVDPAQIPALKASGDADPDTEVPDAAAVAASNAAVSTTTLAQPPAPAANGSTAAAEAAFTARPARGADRAHRPAARGGHGGAARDGHPAAGADGACRRRARSGRADRPG